MLAGHNSGLLLCARRSSITPIADPHPPSPPPLPQRGNWAVELGGPHLLEPRYDKLGLPAQFSASAT
ncbi:hypothetical protein ABZ897_51155 [Nonomuraea sp. NPDC046802]|uniref:hypothetical protein n=1 Tax=Nonomuraea sp. NPDC046802 TaxID=3154919 RepID=UPI0033C970DD